MSNERRHPNIVNKDEVQPNEMKKGKHHAISRRLGPAAGNVQLGCSVVELPPGAISYPFHYHCANEEACYVVSGTGTVRLGDARVKIRPGDWIAHPVGPGNGHQMINDGTEPLIYLCMSTMHKAEVVGYPDSNKLGFAARDSMENTWHRQLVRMGESLDYWDGEPQS